MLAIFITIQGDKGNCKRPGKEGARKKISQMIGICLLTFRLQVA